MPRLLLASGAILGFLSITIGAFGAHALKDRLAPDMLGVFETGARYQMYHALAILVIGAIGLSRPSATLHAAGGAMLIGVLVFSGSLYLLALTGTRWLGAITPVGGLAFLGGWALLVAAALRL